MACRLQTPFPSQCSSPPSRRVLFRRSSTTSRRYKNNVHLSDTLTKSVSTTCNQSVADHFFILSANTKKRSTAVEITTFSQHKAAICELVISSIYSRTANPFSAIRCMKRELGGTILGMQNLKLTCLSSVAGELSPFIRPNCASPPKAWPPANRRQPASPHPKSTSTRHSQNKAPRMPRPRPYPPSPTARSFAAFPVPPCENPAVKEA